MTYEVIVLPRAEAQLLEAATWWSKNHSIEQAYRRLEGFEAAIASLATAPEKLGVARENGLYDFPFTVRQLIYGLGKRPTHRAIVEIRGRTVYVHAIRRLAQDEIRPADL